MEVTEFVKIMSRILLGLGVIFLFGILSITFDDTLSVFFGCVYAIPPIVTFVIGYLLGFLKLAKSE